MTDQTESPRTHPAADGDDQWTTSIGVHYDKKKQLSRYIRWYVLVSIAVTAVWTAVNTILMPNQIQLLTFGDFFAGADAGVDLPALTELGRQVAAGSVTPTADQQRQLALLTDFEAARASGLALVTTTSAIIVMILQPIIGVLSDRTRSRLGRRAPWILYAGLFGAVMLVVVRYAPSMAVLLVLWSITELSLNVAGNPLQATVADRVARNRRGRVTSYTSLGSILGGLFGGIGAGALFGLIGLDFYLILGLLVAITVVLFVFRNPDRSSVDVPREKFDWGSFVRGYASALLARDYRWLWISRVLLFFGYSTSTALSLYMLQSYISPAMSAAEASAVSPLLGLAGLPLTLIAVAVSGRLSDRFGRRKPFIVVASVLMAVSMAVPLLSPTLPALFVQTALASVAFGIYLPVDNAMFIDVLPDPEKAGRDLGLSIVATNLGQSLAPLLAAQVVLLTGGYQMVWLAALILVGFASITILRVRERRDTDAAVGAA